MQSVFVALHHPRIPTFVYFLEPCTICVSLLGHFKAMLFCLLKLYDLLKQTPLWRLNRLWHTDQCITKKVSAKYAYQELFRSLSPPLRGNQSIGIQSFHVFPLFELALGNE